MTHVLARAEKFRRGILNWKLFTNNHFHFLIPWNRRLTNCYFRGPHCIPAHSSPLPPHTHTHTHTYTYILPAFYGHRSFTTVFVIAHHWQYLEHTTDTTLSIPLTLPWAHHWQYLEHTTDTNLSIPLTVPWAHYWHYLEHTTDSTLSTPLTLPWAYHRQYLEHTTDTTFSQSSAIHSHCRNTSIGIAARLRNE
jgi:hypothetical protein